MTNENKPEYEFRYQIIDKNLDHVVVTGSTYVSNIETDGGCESVEMELFAGLRAFGNKIRENYERNNYRIGEEEPETI